ncbi:hypothetical protein [Aliikangiella coralliicola]|uniref:Uncharacterized protein n=1 Tax=Aliikangiella coralliicola TaxID=2592383 RepID=A0A545U7C1_9GAMM|nr:hypothetical protein [Aliikangiella coralliicola]TQV85365.1 hypothetical protein FLL46_19560 [Aliikangiella coralliicola]
MNTSVLSKLFWVLAFCCFLLLRNCSEQGAGLGNEESGWRQLVDFSDSTELSDSDRQKYPRFSKAYQDVLEASEADQRLKLIKAALVVANEESFQSGPILKQLHLMAADIHQSKWHHLFAIESLVKAQNYQFDKQTDRRLKSLRRHLASNEKERNFNADYVATRATGPAKVLKDRVLVTYIFIDDGVKTRWSKKDMLRSEQVLSEVERWKQLRASEYNIDNLEFINKIFIAQRNPRIKQLSAISHKSATPQIDKFVDAVMEDLGEKNVGDFISKHMKIVGADQGVVIFHSNFERRSFARRCGYTHKRTYYENGKKRTQMISKCREEYVMLMNQVKRNRWDKLHNTQAHEILHLFGADDLYSIKNAASYAATDIMNFYSKNLSDGSIHPITAYAIGWQDHKPEDVPFRVLDK